MEVAKKPEQAAPERWYRNLIDSASEGLAVVNPDGLLTYTNLRLAKILGCSSKELLGHSVFEFVRERERPTAEALFRRRRRRFIPQFELCLRKANGSEFWAAISSSPLFNDDGEYVGTLGCVVDVTERRRAEAAVRAEEAKFRGLLEAAPDAIVIVNSAGQIEIVNAQAEAVLGYRRDELMGQKVEVLVPERFREQHARDRAAYMAHPRNRPMGIHLELYARRKDAQEIPVEISLSPLHAAEGLLITASIRDLTERNRIASAFRRSEAGLREAQQIAHLGNWEWDIRSGECSWSDEVYRIFALDPKQFHPTYDAFLGRVHPEDRERVARGVDAALQQGEPFRLEHRIILPDGTERTVDEQGAVTRDEAGHPVRMLGVVQDITERKQAEDERKELLQRERAAHAEAVLAQHRLSFLAAASGSLGSSLDCQTTLNLVARLAIPTLADWCVVASVAENGFHQLVSLAALNPAREALLQSLQTRQGSPWGSPPRVVAALNTWQSELLSVVDEPALERITQDQEQRQLLRELGLQSGMMIPMVAHGHLLGVIYLAFAESGRRYGRDDLLLAEEFASRAAQAIESARLYAGQREIAHTLQQSLLPPRLPEVPGIELAACYHPAGKGNEVGGDFYDLFETREHHWLILIGDVAGKGPAAAAVTAFARFTARALAMRSDQPSQILSDLNEALLRQYQGDWLITVLLLRLQLGDHPRVTVASAGHPPPLLLHPKGDVKTVESANALLGAFPEFQYTDQEIPLSPGESLVLYTDGVTEARRDHELFGEERLAALVATCAGQDARSILRTIEHDVIEYQQDQLRDDLALLVLRVTS